MLVGSVLNGYGKTSFSLVTDGLKNQMTARFSASSFFTRHVVLLAACLTLAACDTLGLGQSFDTVREPQVVAESDKVSLMLAEAATKSSNALQTLAAIEQEKSPAVAVQPIHNAPQNLMRAMTVSWIGPPEPILRKLADRASYSFITIGNPPPVPLIVQVREDNRPVIDLLRTIGLQLGQRADVSVDSEREIVELHYAPVTGMGQ